MATKPFSNGKAAAGFISYRRVRISRSEAGKTWSGQPPTPVPPIPFPGATFSTVSKAYRLHDSPFASRSHWKREVRLDGSFRTVTDGERPLLGVVLERCCVHLVNHSCGKPPSITNWINGRRGDLRSQSILR